MEKITSRSNEKIKLAVSLKTDAKERKKNGLFFIEGARLCHDAVLSGINIKYFFVTEKASMKYSAETAAITDAAERGYLISEDVSRRLSDTVMPQGIFCLCETIDKNESCYTIYNNGKYIALDNIQNPDNLGAIARAAEALGVSGLIIYDGCDIYNPKALRASMGSLFRIPVIKTDDLPLLLREYGGKGMLTAASVPDESAVKITDAELRGGVICVIGNEGAGISESVKDACKIKVTIPMKGRAESLNAATAAAVLIWEMMKYD
ncbi:MAG: RNA methyltransferase [Clostridiales bacterium]|nr:RNA methyltransferase [Clostridiales bacterium]